MDPINNLTDSTSIGSAALQNGDFLTFDALPTNKYSLLIPSLPHVQFFAQGFTLPSVGIQEVIVPTRFLDYNGVGEKMEFTPFTVTFLVDKYARNWASVFNWMKSITANGSAIDKTDDVVLIIGGKETIRFSQAWPSLLTGFEFDSTVAGVVYVKATVTFSYDFFDYLGQFKTVDSTY